MLALLYFEMVVPTFAVGAVRNSRRHFNRLTHKEVFFAAPPVKQPAPPSVKKTANDNGGPTQPESEAFHSVNADNMVDLFSGNFSYTIPLLDVGGYPLAIGYSSGVDMEQEASWVGLGWNINPGTITRNTRGVPDDFNGADSIVKTVSVKENKTIGVTGGIDLELLGGPLTLGVGVGVLHNTYRGWGMEASVNAGINVASSTAGSLGANLSVTTSSQEGLSVSPGLSASLGAKDASATGGLTGSLSLGLGYNSRTGMKALQYSAGIRAYGKNEEKAIALKEMTGAAEKSYAGIGGFATGFSSHISFAYPTFTPGINIPYTSSMLAVSVKLGGAAFLAFPNLLVSGYVSRQFIAPEDRRIALPAYGYLNFQNGARNPGSLLDYNREREIPYREKPAVPNIAIPSYTYDVFSIASEGNGGSFRAYRSDIGYVRDHSMRTRDVSNSFGTNLGFGYLFHVGVDAMLTRAYTQDGAWEEGNPLAKTIAFTKPSKTYEAVYFRNPGEKAINTKDFYNAIGGDDLVRPKLFQDRPNSVNITSTNYLTRFSRGRATGDVKLTAANVTKKKRDKRVQVISYLNAEEASKAGFNQYIENYQLNKFTVQTCNTPFPDDLGGDGIGFKGEYFNDIHLRNRVYQKNVPVLSFQNSGELTANPPPGATPLGQNDFSVRWSGRIKAPVTGVYTIHTTSDDGIAVFVNDTAVIDEWTDHSVMTKDATVNLEAGEVYKVRVDYYNGPGVANLVVEWKCGDVTIGTKDMYWPDTTDTFEAVPGTLVKEERINSFRKANHISQIDVLNNDGKRYIYGLPVYNLKQKEVTFSVNNTDGNAKEGIASYNDGIDNTIGNKKGNDNYFTSEETPAFAHSFLLTALVSPDYVDLTGNGISDDDPGNAIRFNYTKTAGVNNPYKWRTPYTTKASYNEGLKSDTRDDKGSYVYGEKELWYLNSIESKNMIAVFVLEDRDDLKPINENGTIDPANPAKRLKEINLYSKADFLKRNTAARPVKTVHFKYSYELCPGMDPANPGQGKLTLKKVWFTYNGNKKGERNAYVFNYGQNPGYNARASDRWGTYKDPLHNPGSTAGNLVTNAEFPYAVQDSAVAAGNVGAWALDSIALPSGGRMKVQYESDDYAFVQNRRAAQMSAIAGFSGAEPHQLSDLSNRLYGSSDHLYVAIHVPEAVTSKAEVYRKYLDGMETFYFRLHVKMPSDKWGNGHEFVSGYARIDGSSYGYLNDGHTIWVKLVSINKHGEDGGDYSPMAKTAVQFLRLNLPSKAYPGSDVGDNLDLVDGVKVLFSMADNIRNAIQGFDMTARQNKWARDVDLVRSFVRLNNPDYKKYGGGHRVKRIIIYDHWNAMTGQKESMYGTEYSYTTTKNIHGKDQEISSGVAIYEPMLGGEENPFRVPIEYNEQVAPLAPTTLGYVEMPLGESLFPGASVGYSKIRKRSIKTKQTRSANGYEDTEFYTACDFPTIVEHTLLDNQSKLRYKPELANLLKINARHHVAISQGFKIELNDMHGKMKSKSVYAETDPVHPISQTINYYHVDDVSAPVKHLNNTLLTMNPYGEIDSLSTIGKDIELMMDMRQQKFVSNSTIMNANVDAFAVFIYFMALPTFWMFPQRQENIYRSAAATKVINRQGILDSTVAIEKGSKVVTQNMLFDAETGDVLLTATQNEYGDTLYHFSYPAGWMYDGMSGAYKNINMELENINITEGRITAGLSPGEADTLFASGDEILIYSRNKVSENGCDPILATFRSAGKIWAVDANALSGGAPSLYFMDRDGKPFTGDDIKMKVIRSGRRNISVAVGEVTMLRNPLGIVNGKYQLSIDEHSQIINASMAEYKQNWQIEDSKKSKIICAY